jgi:hypothetical protein
MQSSPPLRAERDLGTRMSFTFSLFRTYFGTIFKSILWLAAPLIAVTSILILVMIKMPIAGWTSEYRVSSDFDMIINQISNHPTYFLVLILLQSTGMVMVIAIVNAFLHQYLINPNEIISKNIQQFALKSFLKYIIIFLMFFIITSIFGGIIYLIQKTLNIGNTIQLLIFMSLFVLIISIYSIFTYIIVEIEKKNFINAYLRSFQITKGYWWETFAYFSLFFIIIYFLAMLFVLPFSLLISISEFHKISSSQDDSWINIISALATAFSTIGSMFLFSLFWFAVGVQYFYMVETKEMIGLKEAINTIGVKMQKDEEEGY